MDADAEYTYPGDPLKIDCGYRPNGVVKMFQGMPLRGNIDAAKVLAFSFPLIEASIKEKENASCKMTAVVEEFLDRNERRHPFCARGLG